LHGRTVRPGRLYRSDGLHRLTGTDLDTFATLGVRTVLDLRRPDELAAEGRLAPADGWAYHHVNFHVEPWPDADLTPADMPRFLADRYADMADAAVNGDQPFARCLRLLADERALPLAFHCAAGKDRTGVLAALTLSLLGVADDDVADDYARSAGLVVPLLRGRRDDDGPPPAWELNPSPAEAMHLFLAELRQRYGSVADYAERAGVGAAQLDALRAALLYG